MMLADNIFRMLHENALLMFLNDIEKKMFQKYIFFSFKDQIQDRR